MRKVKADQVFYAVAFAISIFGLIYSAGLTMPYGLDLILMLIRFLVTVACGYFFLDGSCTGELGIEWLTCSSKKYKQYSQIESNNALNCLC